MATTCLETIPVASTQSAVAVASSRSPTPIMSTVNHRPEEPRRNLTEAFEALCAVDTTAAEGVVLSVHPPTPLSDTVLSPMTLKEVEPLISPTGVVDVPQPTMPLVEEDNEVAEAEESHSSSSPQRHLLPVLELHPDLQRDLSNHLVHRTSYYSLIHDVNKEAAAMHSHDPLARGGAASAAGAEPEDDSAVVRAVLGMPASDNGSAAAASYSSSSAATATASSFAAIAIVDEEEWLLSAVASRSSAETTQMTRASTATFQQAMGEKEYENPISAVTGHARTQLWKPSRSWWEAKSGKNPWIEPASHNKRWRYLWPLIHYHKFLAKCIKKLKRNGVDVKQSVSPVAVFLRVEVCAVSDHLAAVSLFDSDQWMDCLKHFHGWIVMTDAAEASYRRWFVTLKLRPLLEPGDVDSPLLRHQIDENYLRTMVAQREQMRETAQAPGLKKSTASSTRSSTVTSASGHPPMYPRVSPQQSVPKQIHGGLRRPRYFGQQGWYAWEQMTPQPAVVDASSVSVHSGLSADTHSFPQHQMPVPPHPHHQHHHHHYEYGMYPVHPYYAGASLYHPGGSSDHSNHSGGYYSAVASMYDPHAWMDPNGMVYAQPPSYYAPTSPAYEAVEGDGCGPVPENEDGELAEADDHTPHKHEQDASGMAQSPYWAHLDQATLALGLATPAKSSPSTPRRRRGDDKRDDHENDDALESSVDVAKESSSSTQAMTAQPPLVRQHYYSHGGPLYGARDGFAPPSPATQFMMSPQPGFGYSFGYGFSPRPLYGVERSSTTPRSASKRQPPSFAGGPGPAVAGGCPTGSAAQPAPHALTPERKVLDRELSPSTVETTTETESMDPIGA